MRWTLSIALPCPILHPPTKRTPLSFLFPFPFYLPRHLSYPSTFQKFAAVFYNRSKRITALNPPHQRAFTVKWTRGALTFRNTWLFVSRCRRHTSHFLVLAMFFYTRRGRRPEHFNSMTASLATLQMWRRWACKILESILHSYTFLSAVPSNLLASAAHPIQFSHKTQPNFLYPLYFIRNLRSLARAPPKSPRNREFGMNLRWIWILTDTRCLVCSVLDTRRRL
jgi:hypothetical protein